MLATSLQRPLTPFYMTPINTGITLYLGRFHSLAPSFLLSFSVTLPNAVF